jgi:glucose-1-phosphate thymidylyltransferase
MKCLLLASGFGTRLYPLTKKTPKGLLPYQGKPVITHIVERMPPDIEVHITTNLRFEDQFGKWREELSRNVNLFVEPVASEEERLGAVSSIEYFVRKNSINEDLLVIASDNYFDFGVADFIACFDGRLALNAVYDIGSLEEARQFGVVSLSGDRLTALAEKPEKPASSLISTACYIFPARVLPMLADYCCTGKCDNLGNFISHLIRNDGVRAYVFRGTWFDIGSLWPKLIAGEGKT